MVSIRKRTWTNASGKHTAFEINYVKDGKQYRKSGFKSALEAQLALKDFYFDESTDIKFYNLAKLYIDRHCALNCKSSTIVLYNNYLKINLTTLHDIVAKELKKKDLENLVFTLKMEGKSNSTINVILGVVQAILNYGVDSGYLNNNPVSRFKKLPKEKTEIKFLNVEQMTIFLQLVKELPINYGLLCITALFTGMRKGELLGLEWSDIDFKKNTININKQIYRGKTQTTKTNKVRIIDMSENLKNMLMEHKRNTNIFTKYVFHLANGNFINVNVLRSSYFRPLIRKCNEYLPLDNQIVKGFTFHDLRHTHATYLLSEGVPIKYVQKRLGHSTAKMTLDIYANVMPSVKFEALKTLEKIQINTQIEHKLNTAK